VGLVLIRSRGAARDESGAIAVLVGITAAALFVVAALVVDLGLARDTRRQSQNAADASALAAANVLYPAGTCKPPGVGSPPCITDAVDAAKSYAATNFAVTDADWARCTSAPAGFVVPAGAPTCISFDSLAKPTKVWVVMPVRDVKTGFGVLAEVKNVPVSSAARAVVVPGGSASCGLCLLGSGDHYIQTGDIVVSDTDVQANGNLGTQHVNGHLTVTGGVVSVEGSASGNISPAAQTGAGTLTDPLAGIELPASTNSYFNIPTGLRTNICSQGPGFYKNPSVGSNCVLQPGLYVITGTLKLAGNKSIDATAGVTLYFTCGTSPVPSPCADGGEDGGSMTYTGNATLSIHAPATGPTKGLAIVSDRNNTSDIEFKGNGAGSLIGTVYAASGAFGFRGNGAGASMDALIVVNDVVLKGNPSAMSLVYGESTNVELPPGAPSLDR
jgi:hypothetical protein